MLVRKSRTVLDVVAFQTQGLVQGQARIESLPLPAHHVQLASAEGAAAARLAASAPSPRLANRTLAVHAEPLRQQRPPVQRCSSTSRSRTVEFSKLAVKTVEQKY